MTTTKTMTGTIAPPGDPADAPASRTARFFSWWIGELAGLGESRRKTARAWQSLLLKTPDGIEIFARRRGKFRALAMVPADELRGGRIARLPGRARRALRRSRIVLRLGDDMVLERTLNIPRSARDVAEPIIANQMERIIPWPIGEARIGYAIAEDEESGDHFSARVIATSSTVLAEARHDAEVLGGRIAAIEFADGPAVPEGIPLAEGDEDAPRRRKRRVAGKLVLLLAASLVVGGIGIARLIPVRAEWQGLEARIAAVRDKLAAGRRANARMAARIEQRGRVIEARRKAPAIVVVLDALTRVLPDDAYLTRLEIRGRKVLLAGHSGDAAGLIEKLESSPYFSAAGFSAPTTRQPGRRGEQFTISVRLSESLGS